MRAPKYERMRMLDAAIGRASDELDAPIDRLEVAGGHVTCWSGTRSVIMAYGYAQGGGEDPVTGAFIPYPGSGDWYVTVVQAPPPRRTGWLRRVWLWLSKTPDGKGG
jgi:hypothetical protein